MKTNAPQFWPGFVQHFRDQSAFAKDHACALFSRPPGRTSASQIFVFDLANQKYLDLPTRLLALSDQPRGNNARVVHDHNIVRTKITE